MGWYCKECDDWFIFGYSKKYCSEDCYDEKEERKERKREKKRAKARQEEILRNELLTLKSSFKTKWDINYLSSPSDSIKIQTLINQENILNKDIEELRILALAIKNI